MFSTTKEMEGISKKEGISSENVQELWVEALLYISENKF